MSNLVKRLRDGEFSAEDVWEAADHIEALEAALRQAQKERDDYKARFESLHTDRMNEISGGRYPDGKPAW
jgi:cell division protein FtsB